MKQQQKTYSIFCDESCHLQFDNSDIMCIGAIVVSDADLDTYKFALKQIKRRYNILHELKWNTVSRTHLAMYDEIVRFFFESSMVFRSVLIKNINPNFALITGFCVDQSNQAYYMRKLQNKA